MSNKTHTPAPRPFGRFRARRLWRQLPDVAAYLAVMFAIGYLIFIGAGKLGYNWQWYRIPPYFGAVGGGAFVPGPLLKGLRLTLEITGWGLGLAFAIGLLTALLRLSHSPVGRLLSRCYLEVIRNTPLLVQLFFIYFVISPIIGVGRFQAAVIALSLFEGAYTSEIFRAGILSIHEGQWEAAFSLGLSRWQTYRQVVLPQAVRRMLPPLTSQAISLIKDSALVSTVAVYDLTMQGQAIVSETYLVFEVWFVVAAVYLAMTMTLSAVVSYLKFRFAVAP